MKRWMVEFQGKDGFPCPAEKDHCPFSPDGEGHCTCLGGEDCPAIPSPAQPDLRENCTDCILIGVCNKPERRAPRKSRGCNDIQLTAISAFKDITQPDLREAVEKRHIEMMRSEIIAGSILFPKTDVDRAWNQANQRAGDIIAGYLIGEGLSQMVEQAALTTKGKE